MNGRREEQGVGMGKGGHNKSTGGNFLSISEVTITSSVRRQKGLPGYCFKYTDRYFCLRTDDMCLWHGNININITRKLYLLVMGNYVCKWKIHIMYKASSLQQDPTLIFIKHSQHFGFDTDSSKFD